MVAKPLNIFCLSHCPFKNIFLKIKKMDRIVKKLNVLSTKTYKTLGGEYLVSDIVDHGNSIIIRLSNNSIIYLKSNVLSRDEIKFLNEYADLRVVSDGKVLKYILH